MNEVIDFITRQVYQSGCPLYVYGLTLLAIIALTQLIKLPIKKLTSKCKNENLRHLFNVTIVFIPIALGFAIGGLYTLIPYKFSYKMCLSWGTTSQVIYELLSRIIVRLKKDGTITNATITEDFEAAKETVDEADKAFSELAESIIKGDEK